MNSEQKTNKGRVFSTLLFITCSLLLGCNTPIELEKDAMMAEPGYGMVRIQFPGWEGRTAFPSLYFTDYVYTFTKNSGAPQEVEPVNGVFTLETGSWKVQVKAYVGGVADANLAATGDAEFNLQSGPILEVTIYLVENESSGKPGTFVYTIQYPSGTVREQFTMTKLPDMTDVSLNPTSLSAGNGITQTMNNIPYGFYRLNIQLAHTGRHAGISEIIHIYPMQTTHYEKNFLVSAFSGMYTVTFYADGGIPAPPALNIPPGGKATEPPPMTKLGYTLDGWYMEETFINLWDFDTDVSENLNLYAKWVLGQVWVSRNGGVDVPFVNLQDALDSITTAGNYIVKIGADQTLDPYTFTGSGIRNITLIPVYNPVTTVELTDNGSLFTVDSNITLTLDEGVILQGMDDNDASLIQVKAQGNLIMKTGSLVTGNSVTDSGEGVSGASGGGVNVDSGGTFTMSGGKISGNIATASSSPYGRGGGVYMNGGTFTMNGGEISGNTANYYGGGVYVNSGTFIMENGKIDENNGSGVYTYGTFTMRGGEIYRNNSGGVYTHGNFTMRDGRIYENNGNGVYTSGTFTMESGEISGNTGGGVYTYGNFTMESGEISGNTAYQGGGVRVDGGSFTMRNGKIFNNTSTNSSYDGDGGGGVRVRSGTFTMLNGEISGNTASYSGGGVSVSGIFTMSNGKISGNTTSYSGGGVTVFDYTGNAKFTMSGGEISENTTGTYGGGVYVYNNCNFIMSGGEISQNTADAGGGVRLRDGYFTMSGGRISRNTAENSGGGVDMGERSEFKMEGGEISGNKSYSSGGGVYVSGIFTKTGGTITGYSSNSVNGNVVKDGDDNVKNNQGHAVYAEKSNILKRKEYTAGPTDNLMFNGTNNPVSSSGAWD